MASGAVNISTIKDENNSLKEEEIDPCPLQHGYRISLWRCLLFYPLAILPAGTGLLFAYWYPHLWLRLTCYKCDLERAQFVLVQDLDLKWKVEVVRKISNSSSQSNNSSPSLSLNEENGTLINEEDNENELSPLLTTSSTATPYILHRHLRYLYDRTEEKYIVLRGLESSMTCSEAYRHGNGLSRLEHERRFGMYGSNSIEVPVKPYHSLFIEEVLHPFYIFQILSVIFWMADSYFYYAGAVLIIFIVSMFVSLVQTRRHMQRLHDMVKTSGHVTVIRDNQRCHDVSIEDLVPGDVMVVPPEGMRLTCDAVLLTGSAIVNEAMLTGESVPVTKTALPSGPKTYSPTTHKMHTLFAGTHVVQARYYSGQLILALVVRTGFLTAKGGMVRSILYPKPLNIKFYWDSLKFILLLSILAGVGFVYTILVLQLRKSRYEVSETIFRAFDIITTIVPPSLPAAITIGTVYAVNRLKKNKIYCISPQRVNLCGKVKLVCFDKTGTLTEESLDLLGVQPVSNYKLQDLLDDINQVPHSSPFLQGLATCHSLTRINGELTGDPLDLKMFQSTRWFLEEPGEDITRFDTLRFPIVRPRQTTPTSPTSSCSSIDYTSTDIELGILKQFTFSSELQRMSVIVRKLPSVNARNLKVFTKGAPEMIKKLSRPESIPKDFDMVLGSLTSKGYRVLAMAYRDIRKDFHQAMKLERDDVECDLNFCGLIVFENRLKEQTPPTLIMLRNSAIRTVMVTGDNLLTAIAVSRNSGMVAKEHHVIVLKATPMNGERSPKLHYQPFEDKNVNLSKLCSSTSSYLSNSKFSIQNGVRLDELGPAVERGGVTQYFHVAIDGRNFNIVREQFPKEYSRLLVSGTIFARMSPLNKKQLVTDLMTLGYGVAMCGDGANDCGALKAAHVGISLSDTEASVASPFTSNIPNITCVPAAIKEGRAALVTSFSVFKFMALYSLTEFTSVAILYSMESNLGDIQYLYVDLVLILSFAFVMGLTGPYSRIVKRRPLGTLAGIHVFSSILIQTGLMILGQLAMYYYLKSEPWYVPFVPDPNGENISCPENTVIFTASIFQYIVLVIAFSTAAPYRKPIYTNVLFMLSLAILIPACLYIALAPPTWLPWFWRFFQLEPVPHSLFRLTLVMCAGIHLLLAYLIEGYLLSSSFIHKLFRFVRCKRKPKNLYKHLLLEIKSDRQWPPPLPNGVSAHC